MKKLFTLFLSFAIATIALGQSERLVLVEEGTNASCGPCATQNPAFNALLDDNTDNVVSIKYQWYFPGYDPMHEHNPEEADGRFNGYYGQNGVPTSMIDGDVPDGSTPGFDPGNQGWYDGAPGGYSQALLDDYADVPASFDIDLSFDLTPQEITVNAMATCTQAESGDLRFRIVVIEKEILFDSAPGSNGETEFYNVMKKFLPGLAGNSMEDTYEVGDQYSVTESWELANIYDIEEVAVVAFIQNDDNKEVLQAAFASEGNFEAAFAYDASVDNVAGLPDFSCESVVNPTVEIRNDGSENLTSLDIEYTLNDANGTIEWTGDLGFYESTTVELGEITFQPESENNLVVSVSNPSGEADENTSNDEVEEEVSLAAESTMDVTVLIRTDYYAGETSWEIRNSSNQVVASDGYEFGDDDQFGGGGPDALVEHSYELMLDPFECYTFTLFDEFGDGMGYTGQDPPAGFPPFGYQILDGNGEVVTELLGDINSMNFGDNTSDAFRTTDALDVDNSLLNTSLSVYPNPANEQVNIAFELESAQKITVDIYSISGQLIQSKDYGTLSAGRTLETVDVSAMSSGFYLININTPDNQVVRKLTIAE